MCLLSIVSPSCAQTPMTRKPTASLTWVLTHDPEWFATSNVYGYVSADFTPVNYSLSASARVVFVNQPKPSSCPWLWAEKLARLRTTHTVGDYKYHNLQAVVILGDRPPTLLYPIGYMFEGIRGAADRTVPLADRPPYAPTPVTPL